MRNFLVFLFISAIAAGDDPAPVRILVYTRSQTFIHPVVKPQGDQPSVVDRTCIDLGAKHGWQVTCTKDGGHFTTERLKAFDVLLFYTTGDLTKPGGDQQPPMPPDGKQAYLDLVASGRGFIGLHCASDTFHSKPDPKAAVPSLDPHVAMLGGEFIVHGAQQKATVQVVDPAFPGIGGFAKDGTDIMEEWYALKHFPADLHVLLTLTTAGMKGAMYQRPNYPVAWIRTHGAGRVFYTALGHREDVWTNPRFTDLLVGAVSWGAGRVAADTTPNLAQAAPQANFLSQPK